MSRKEINDIRYMSVFSVEVHEDSNPSAIELAYVIDFTVDGLISDDQPSEKFILDAIGLIKKLEWKHAQDENGNTKKQSAYCYVLKSNPDRPICSNNMER